MDQLRAAAAELGAVLSEEADLLGTAGGIEHAKALLGEGDVLLWNADILADVDVAALLAAHAVGGAGENVVATLVVQPLERGQGSVGVDEAGRIVRLRQERFAEEAQGGQFLGVHVLGRALRARLPERGGLIEDVYLPALGQGDVLRAHSFAGPWYDIGTIASYLEANVAWLAARGLARWIGLRARLGAGVALDSMRRGRGRVGDRGGHARPVRRLAGGGCGGAPRGPGHFSR